MDNWKTVLSVSINSNQATFTIVFQELAIDFDNMSWRLLQLVLSLICLVLSYAGNTCTIMVLRKSTWRKRAATTKLLFCVLAVTDMCYMSFFVINGVRQQLTEPLPDSIEKVCTVVWGILYNYSISVLVVISVERFVCIFCPLKVHDYFSLQNCKIVLVFLFLIIVFWNVLNVLWVMTLTLYIVAYVLIDFALPFLMITLITIAIAVKLWLIQNQDINQRRSRATNASATELLIAANVCFLLTMLPVRVYYVCFVFSPSVCSNKYFYQWLYFLHNLNFALNFYVYCVCNENFRNDALILLGCRHVPDSRTRSGPHGLEQGTTLSHRSWHNPLTNVRKYWKGSVCHTSVRPVNILCGLQFRFCLSFLTFVKTYFTELFKRCSFG